MLWILSFAAFDAAAAPAPVAPHRCRSAVLPTRACDCLFVLDAADWYDSVTDRSDLSGTCFQVYEVMDASSGDPAIAETMWARAHRLAFELFFSRLVVNEEKRLVSFDDKATLVGDWPIFVPTQDQWIVYQGNTPISALQTQGVPPSWGVLVDDDGDQQTDLVVMLENGNAWVVFGPLDPKLVAALQ